MLCNRCGANLKEVGITLKTFAGCSYDEFEDKFVVMNVSYDTDSIAFCGKCNNMIDDEILKETEFIL